MSRINPYILGRPVNQDLLFGRECSFVDISDYLQDHKKVKKVLVLYGQRRIGKSSILRNITNKLKELHNESYSNFAVVTLSLEYYSQQSLGTVLAELAKEIISDLSLEDKNIELPEITKLESDVSVFDNEFLPQVYQALENKNLVLALDDFDIFINTHPEISLSVFYRNLFSIIQRDKKLFLILVMDHRLLKTSEKIRSFQNLATIKEITLLDQHTTTNLIKQPAQNMLEYAEDAIQEIFHLSAGHPYFTQLICFAIFSKARENNNFGNKVNKKDVESIVNKAIELAEAGLSWFWQQFSIIEKVVLSAVAESQNISENYLHLIARNQSNRDTIDINLIKRTKEYLQENNFLDSTKHEKVKIELFRQWIIKYHPLHEEISQLEKSTLAEKQSNEQLQGEHIKGVFKPNIPTTQVWDNDKTDFLLAASYYKVDKQVDTHQNRPDIFHVRSQFNTSKRDEELDIYQRRRSILTIISLVCLFVTSSIILAKIYRLYTEPCPPGEKKEFGVFCAVDNSVISRGDRTFFPNITNQLRDQGIQAFKEGDYTKATELFKQAIEANKKPSENDPEILIYYNNARANVQGSPLARLAVVISINTGNNISNNQENNTLKINNAQEILRGVAQAQNEFNEKRERRNGKSSRLIEIVIANDSNKINTAKQVAQELVKDSAILGVIGHNSIDTTKSALQEYQQANLAIISPTSIAERLKTNKASKDSVLFTLSSNKNEISEFSRNATQDFIEASSLSPNSNSRTMILKNLKEVQLPTQEISGDTVEFRQKKETN
ncbi:NB-ARC domain-containing protein [Sphaerospermopsis sp. FACHB-1194]|uniref:NB-ARC domain-containing protein n=1 Tax=Sphaerospermopsis sp. FACHB-1194 TaxID=2692862 RepID=UPI001681B874|nr:NB-ARC domain-containing protein [Sphaerospermopsis sp. FACHB-1194]MBD2143707.1 hypothetical protein [Sphaerospermopsis sp. FACHB-1194]